MKLQVKKKQWVLAWLPVILWMAVIFLLSAQTSDRSDDTSGSIMRWVLNLLYRGFDHYPLEKQAAILEVWHVIIRKGAHFTEYAVLAILLTNALRQYALPRRLARLLPVGISMVYAVSDELHQYFVPGRACRLLDIGIDACGAVFGVCLFAAGGAILRNRRKRGIL